MKTIINSDSAHIAKKSAITPTPSVGQSIIFGLEDYQYLQCNIGFVASCSERIADLEAVHIECYKSTLSRYTLAATYKVRVYVKGRLNCLTAENIKDGSMQVIIPTQYAEFLVPNHIAVHLSNFFKELKYDYIRERPI